MAVLTTDGRRRGLVLGLGLSGCFQSSFLEGLPCTSDRECDGLACIDGVCGGTSTSSSSTTTTTTATTTITITTIATADATSSSSESSSSGGPGCALPPHAPCDGSNQLLFALELGCDGEWPVVGAPTGATQSFSTSAVIGGFLPRAGERFAVIGTGLAAELEVEPPVGDPPNMPTVCSDDVVDEASDVLTLPSPLVAEGPAGDCVDDPALIGERLDCSHSLEGSITQVHDYAELRIGTTVPDDARSFSFELAFSSTESPFYEGAEYNDLFVAWLQSDAWTGNIAYAGGSPISVNSDLLLPAGATTSLLAGTCMRDHGTTGWLTTSAPVVPGEEIVIVFAIFDQTDSIVDSFVFLDAFEWSCAPVTRPETHA